MNLSTLDHTTENKAETKNVSNYFDDLMSIFFKEKLDENDKNYNYEEKIKVSVEIIQNFLYNVIISITVIL